MRSRSAGFSLIELMVAMSILLVISGVAFTALLKLSTTQSTIWNRTQMHSGIRGATEVLQQEVGQAGRISLTSSDATCTKNTLLPCLKAPTTADPVTPQTIAVNSVCGMFVGEKISLDTLDKAETVSITKINSVTTDPGAATCPTANTISSGTITAIFTAAHATLTPLQAIGGFVNGIVPTSIANGSTSSVLKLFGDVNADGNMVYVEYSVSPACICTASCTPRKLRAPVFEWYTGCRASMYVSRSSSVA